MRVFEALAYLLDLDRWPPWARRAWLVLLPIALPVWCVLWAIKIILVIVLSVPVIYDILAVVIMDKLAGRKPPPRRLMANKKDASKDKS